MTKNLYRGKPVAGTVSEPWVYGAYYRHEPPLIAFGEQKEKIKPFIVRTAFADWNMPRQAEHVPIVEGSQGQFTGLFAVESHRGEKEEDLMIFEGDILDFEDNHKTRLVIFDQGSFQVLWSGGFSPLRYTLTRDNLSLRAKIIGDKTYNFDLIKGIKLYESFLGTT